MRLSRFVAAVVIVAALLAGVGALATLVTSGIGLPAAIVVGLAILYVTIASVLGGRSRRWLVNPYW